MTLRSLLLSLALALVALPGAVHAQSTDPDEIKAAFVYNFARFTTFPRASFGGPGAPIRVCVPPGSPQSAALARLDGKEAGGRLVSVVPATAGGAICHIRIVAGTGRDPRRSPSDWQRTLLTVGDAPGFADGGGSFGLVQVGRQVRFEVNARSIERAGLSVSSKLLRLALDVKY